MTPGSTLAGPRVEIVCVGTELLSGKINTHTSTLSRALEGIGLSVAREAAVVDSLPEIRDAVRAALERSQVVLVSGGLGPTFDDITREACSEALGVPLVYHPDIYSAIQKKYLKVYRRIPKGNQRQAYILQGARVLANRFGSAPGQLWRGGEKALVLFPGPPWELVPMLHDVLPILKKAFSSSIVLRKKIFHLCGISESAADEKLQSLIRRSRPGVEFTILARHGLVDFHVTARGASAREAERLCRWASREVQRCVGRHIFGTDGENLESVVGRILRDRRWKIATAESCTGGLLSGRITETPGSSDYFVGGIVSYSNAVKESMLGVGSRTLREHGAVSQECALEMAEASRSRFHAHCAVSITGIAGPGGATPGKPVGLVYMALARAGAPSQVRRHLFPGTRDQIRERSVVAALSMLRDALTS